MKKFNIKMMTERGSMMVEALAMLGLITMVTPILYKKAAERTTELQDINTATQMRMVSSAFDQYLKDKYSTLSAKYVAGAETEGNVDEEDINIEEIKKYLPQGFDLEKSKLFNDLQFAATWEKIEAEDGHQPSMSFTSAVLAPYREEIARARSSKIASMVGANGGNYLDKALPGDDDKIVAHGVQGIWKIPLQGEESLFADADIGDNGGLLVVSADAINSAKGDVNSDDVLYRTPQPGTDKNTMKTTLQMDGNAIAEVTKLIAQSGGNEINLNDSGNILLNGATKIANALTVAAGATISGGLTADSATISGEASIGNNLTVQNGDLAVNNGNATIGGTLTANGATINSGQLIANDGAVLHGGNGGNGATLTVSNTETSVSGGEFKALQGATITGGLEANAGNALLTVKADTGVFIRGNDSANLTISGAEVKVDGGKLTATSGANITGDLKINPNGESGKFDVYKDKQPREIGSDGGHMLSHFKNEKTDIWAADSSLTNVYDLNVRNELEVHGDAFFDKAIYLNGLKLENSGNTLNITNINNTDIPSELYADWIIARLGFALVEKNSNYFKVTPSEFYYKTGDNIIELKDNSAEIATRNFTLNSPQMKVKDGYTFFGNGDNSIMTTGSPNSTNVKDSIIPNNNVKVAISNTTGIIEVASPESNSGHEGGFIRARRLVADTKNGQYPPTKTQTITTGSGEPSGTITTPMEAFVGLDRFGNTLSQGEEYDFYQVDPAYTSVMNDIKLSSRGGARLSDILPDYINKGIYVVDNTYDDKKITAFAKGYGTGTNFPVILPLDSAAGGFKYKNGSDDGNVWAFDNAYSCESRGPACQASPWLGFVPTPLCPPNYDMAITLNPFRWKMAEVYAVIEDFKTDSDWHDVTNSTDAGHNMEKIQEGFMQNFNNYTDPADAQIGTLNVKTPGEGETDNTTEIYANETNEVGRVTNYQINTWLNTALTEAYDDCNKDESDCTKGVEDFMGWHTIMGFMYHGTDYSDFLGKVIHEDYSDEYGAGHGVNPNGIYWNVFPVYAGELAGFATTYCVFNRHPLDNTGQRYWIWGDGPVVQIDQLNNFRKPYQKPSTPFLDPDLPYKNAW